MLKNHLRSSLAKRPLITLTERRRTIFSFNRLDLANLEQETQPNPITARPRNLRHPSDLHQCWDSDGAARNSKFAPQHRIGRKPLLAYHADAAIPYIFRHPLEEGGGFLWLIERRKQTFAQLQSPRKTRRMSSLFDHWLDSGWATIPQSGKCLKFTYLRGPPQ